MSDPVDINTASVQELDTLPELKGHGYEIVRYREERGGFTELRQLDEVPGLTGKADNLDDVLRVGERCSQFPSAAFHTFLRSRQTLPYFVIAESETPADREAHRAHAGKSSGETYAATLLQLSPDCAIDIVQPADDDAPPICPKTWRAMMRFYSPVRRCTFTTTRPRSGDNLPSCVRCSHRGRHRSNHAPVCRLP